VAALGSVEPLEMRSQLPGSSVGAQWGAVVRACECESAAESTGQGPAAGGQPAKGSASGLIGLEGCTVMAAVSAWGALCSNRGEGLSAWGLGSVLLLPRATVWP